MKPENAEGGAVGCNRLLGRLRLLQRDDGSAFQLVRHPNWNEASVYVTDTSQPAYLSIKQEELAALSPAAIELLRSLADFAAQRLG